MLAYLRKVSRQARDRGASAVEYGLMVAAIAAVIVGVVFGLGTLVKGAFSKTCTAISAVGGRRRNLQLVPRTAGRAARPARPCPGACRRRASPRYRTYRRADDPARTSTTLRPAGG